MTVSILFHLTCRLSSEVYPQPLKKTCLKTRKCWWWSNWLVWRFSWRLLDRRCCSLSFLLGDRFLWELDLPFCDSNNISGNLNESDRTCFNSKSFPIEWSVRDQHKFDRKKGNWNNLRIKWKKGESKGFFRRRGKQWQVWRIQRPARLNQWSTNPATQSKQSLRDVSNAE